MRAITLLSKRWDAFAGGGTLMHVTDMLRRLSGADIVAPSPSHGN